MQLGKGVFSLEDSTPPLFLLLLFYTSGLSHVRCAGSKASVVPPSEVMVSNHWLTVKSQAGASLQNHEIQVILLKMKKGF